MGKQHIHDNEQIHHNRNHNNDHNHNSDLHDQDSYDHEHRNPDHHKHVHHTQDHHDHDHHNPDQLNNDQHKHDHHAHNHHDHDHNHHDHGHHHGLFHSHAPADKMKTAFFFTVVILLFEVVGGLFSHSLALLSDAGHVLTDIAAIGLSWYAINQAHRPPNTKMTFGYHRAGILAALLNAAMLIAIAIWIAIEAYQRFQNPEPINSKWMFISAGVGLCINLYLGLGLRKEDNINVQSAVLHMLGDAMASAGVIVGGIIITLTGWSTVDPILSVLIALLIAFGAWNIIKQTISILMEGIPTGLHLEKVIDTIRSIDGVFDVHDMHVWSITAGKNALSCHIVLDGTLTIRESQGLLRTIEHHLLHLGIKHVTIQTEDATHPHKNSILCCEDDDHEDHGHNDDHDLHTHDHA